MPRKARWTKRDEKLLGRLNLMIEGAETEMEWEILDWALRTIVRYVAPPPPAVASSPDGKDTRNADDNRPPRQATSRNP